MDVWPELDQHMHRLADLDRMASLLSWDQQTIMPRRGAEARARAVATLRVIRHRHLTDPHLGDLLDQARSADLDEPRAAMVRVLTHDRDRAVRLPDDLVRRLALAGSRGQAVWEDARAARDWDRFRPCLEEMVALKREQADLLGHDGEAYDALMDAYEPGMRTARVEPLFAALAEELQTLLRAIAAAGPAPPPPFAERRFADAAQWDFTMRLLRDIGFDLDAGRQDRSAHPFTTTIALHDVRLTTRLDESDPFTGISSTMHEAGHGLYDQGFDPAYEDTPIAEAPSLGLHESQSRLWENLVGRSLPFWRHYTPALAASFGDAMAGASAEDVYREVNRVQPSLIRVEADEVTYNLHILIRFELELALLRGRLEVADLPDAWNAAYQARLGVRPPHAGVGVLQDVHWSTGSFGYFPTYTIGNLYSAILWERIATDLPDIDAQVERAEFAPLLGWLRTHIHRAGYLHEGDDLIERVTGTRLRHGPFMRYLWGKFGPLYGLEIPAEHASGAGGEHP
jgi:carboxypeptidase Taq